MDFLADVDTRYKVTALFFVLAVVPAGLFFIFINSYSAREMAPYSGLYLVLLLIVQFPVTSFFSDILARRNITKVNAYCHQVKQGVYEIPHELPPERGNENDFLRMKRSLYWMGQVIGRREERLVLALQEIHTARNKIVESMEYASLIQNSLLPTGRMMESVFKDYFVWWEPREAVGGDTFWIYPTSTGFFTGVIDCTGHGVPGAFVTMIVHVLLERVGTADFDGDPAAILAYMNRRIKDILGQNQTSPLMDDGFDAALCHVSAENKTLVFSGANLPLFYTEDGRVHEIRGDRAGVGHTRVPAERVYTSHTIRLAPDMRFYLATDGIAEQIGAEKRLPFGKKRLKKKISEVHSLPFAEQREAISARFTLFRGNEDKRDDLTLLGFSPRLH